MKVLIAGDYCPRSRVSDIINKGDFATIFEEVCPLTKQVDYSIVNLECPVVEGDAKPIEKIGPNLKCSRMGVEALKYAGFSCVTLANNHFYDFGEEGVRQTVLSLNESKIDYLGGGDNLDEASKILYKEIGGKTLAIINCCEHEFSIATDKAAGSNPLNPVKQYYALKIAREKADFVLVIIHGGHEHFQLPSLRMVETYRFFIDNGADAVVNHHQHCFSGFELYKGRPIFYGLGNFCFDNIEKQNGIWTEGYAVTIDFSTGGIDFQIHPYLQCAEEPKIKMLPEKSYSKRISELNEIISDANELQKKIIEYYRSSALQYENAFEPTYNRYYLGAKRRGWLKSLIGKRKRLLLENFIICESHRDKVMWWLQSREGR